MSSESGAGTRGLLAWMATNVVAANLLMLVFIGGGLIVGSKVKREIFPHFDLGAVVIEVAYPGAGPAEVEQGVVLAIEEAVRGLDGIREVSSTAREGNAAVMVELLNSADTGQALSDIKAAVDRIQSFPQEIERPIVRLVSNRNQVISLVLYGDVDERSLRRLAETARMDLLDDDRISQVELDAVREPEISIEVSQESLRAYGLTHDEIAAAISMASVEIPAGGVKTAGGEILLRTSERRHVGTEFADIVVLSRPDGSEVKLGAIANIVDGFRETDEEAWFNGKRAAMVTVYRVGDQTPVEIAQVVRDYAAARRQSLPPGVGIATWADRSAMYSERVDLLLRNGALGLVLVLLALGIFLEARLAFWVTVGIPVSFLGAMFLMPVLGVSINMISLFAFIVTIGVVVDDAIVVGDSVYEHRQKGKAFLRAAIEGVREVAAPVTYSVVTTVIAFLPLLFVPGVAGKFFRCIPLVVVAVLLLSLFESLFILPAHLAHGKAPSKTGLLGWVSRGQRRCAYYLKRFIRRQYK
ncbi:MAG: efflux RND transporter permease subunit, partial [Myxococcota bacterium]